MTATVASGIALIERSDALPDLAATRGISLQAVQVGLAWIFIYHRADRLFGAFDGAGLHTTRPFPCRYGPPLIGPFFAVFGGTIEFFGGIAISVGLVSRLATLGSSATWRMSCLGPGKSSNS